MKQFVFGVLFTIVLINYSEIKKTWFSDIPQNAEHLLPVKTGEVQPEFKTWLAEQAGNGSVLRTIRVGKQVIAGKDNPPDYAVAPDGSVSP